MCQRIMIAIALICRPRLLIADEPTTALDVTIQAQILDLMKRSRRTPARALLLITHDMGVVADMADRICVMYAGRVVEEGDVFDAVRAPASPLHEAPARRALPRLDASAKRRARAPSRARCRTPRSWPAGCRFNPRCPLADDICRDRGAAARAGRARRSAPPAGTRDRVAEARRAMSRTALLEVRESARCTTRSAAASCAGRSAP